MHPETSRVEQLFAQWDKPDSPGCALAVMRRGEIIYKRGIGVANLEYGIPITPATIFHVASVSKQFTAFALALLALEGRLSLDDDARKHIPELPDFGATITLRHLVHHTSGLRDQWMLLVAAGWRMEDVITTGDILDLARRQRDLNFRPGDEFAYCNTGYTLMALTVERVSGKPFREFCAERIFQPLGMRHTHFHDDHGEVVKNRAYSYHPEGEHRYRHAVLSYSTAGGTSLFTTVEDLALWDGNFYDAAIGGPAMLDLLHTRGALNDGTLLSYAFGLDIGTYRGLKTVAHDGGDAGFRCRLARYPDQQLTIALLGNVSDLPVTKLVGQVADLYLGDQLEQPDAAGQSRVLPSPAIQPAAEALEQKVGIYFCAATSETLLLELRDGKLVIPSGPGLALEALAPDHFRLTIAPQVEFLFVQAPDGSRQVHETQGSGRPRIYGRVAAAHPSAEELAAYAGTYYSPELDVVRTVHLQDGQLTLRQHKYGDAPMQPTFVDGFKARMTDVAGFPDSMDVVFEREGGMITGFRISAGRIRNLKHLRLPSANGALYMSPESPAQAD
jgi:CubicO group peptidase (beta-lactamase class C family)